MTEALLTLAGVYKDVSTNWIGPAVLLAMAGFSVVFIKDRSFTKLLAFVGIGVIVLVIIYGGDKLFGSKSKIITESTKTANNL